MNDSRIMVLLSGPMAVGKTSVREALVGMFGFECIRSSGYLARRLEHEGVEQSRHNMQELGDLLDCQTDFRWLIDDVVTPVVVGSVSQRKWLIDAVRKERQVAHFRSEFGAMVKHVHLVADATVLRSRYFARQSAMGGDSTEDAYLRAKAHPNEISSCALHGCADQLIDVSNCTALEAAKSICVGIPYLVD